MNKKVLVVILLSIIGVFIAHHYFSTRQSLVTSVDVFFGEKLKTNYVIKAQELNFIDQDSSGLWIVEVNGVGLREGLVEVGFSAADIYDLEYFKSLVGAGFKGVKSLDGYRLFRGQTLLGRGTVCDFSYCNIYVLEKDGVRDIFVGIYKN